jgi:hypothetical protein
MQEEVQSTKTEDGQKHVRGIASDVILDRREGVAIKMYRRRGLIEALYHVAFQAKFPYVDNRAALKASQYRRKIAGLVTKYFLGEDVVTPVVAVERVDGRYRFVTELVKGGEPKDHHKARVFLNEVTQAFIKCGLPTWQVSPHNPRSLGNVMETDDGRYRLIDLESNVVTPMVPVSRLWTSAREAHLPPFDDIDLLKLWAFIDENWGSLQERLGEDDLHQLVVASAKYAWYERLWHGEEPRLWSRARRAHAGTRYARTSASHSAPDFRLEQQRRSRGRLARIRHRPLGLRRKADRGASNPREARHGERADTCGAGSPWCPPDDEYPAPLPAGGDCAVPVDVQLPDEGRTASRDTPPRRRGDAEGEGGAFDSRDGCGRTAGNRFGIVRTGCAAAKQPYLDGRGD